MKSQKHPCGNTPFKIQHHVYEQAQKEASASAVVSHITISSFSALLRREGIKLNMVPKKSPVPYFRYVDKANENSYNYNARV